MVNPIIKNQLASAVCLLDIPETRAHQFLVVYTELLHPVSIPQFLVGYTELVHPVSIPQFLVGYTELVHQLLVTAGVSLYKYTEMVLTIEHPLQHLDIPEMN